MASRNSMVYAARDEICAKLNKSVTGFYLLEHIKKGVPAARRVYESNRLVDELVSALTCVKAVEIRRVPGEIGGRAGSTDYWLYHKERHANDPLPEGLMRIDTPNQEEPPVRLGARIKQLGKTQAITPRPEPAPAKALDRGCTRCQARKPLTEFEVSTRTISGVRGWCKACDAEYAAARDKKAAEQKQPPIQPPVTQEIEIMSIPTKTPARPDMPAVTSAAELRKQAEMMLKQAEAVERQESSSLVLAEVKRQQLEISRHVAITQRVFGEMMDAIDDLAKASEVMRQTLSKTA